MAGVVERRSFAGAVRETGGVRGVAIVGGDGGEVREEESDLFSESLPSSMMTRFGVRNMTVQPTKLKSHNGKVQSFEVIHFKRANFDLDVDSDDGTKSSFKGILHFPSRILTITRKEGHFSTESLIEFLISAHINRYNTDGLRAVDIREDGRVWDCVVEDSKVFIGFIHHLKERGTSTILRETIG